MDTGEGVVRPGAVVVTAGPWTPAIIDPSGAWRPILPYWGVIVELALEAPPTHVLEEAGVDAAIEPDGGLADAEDGAMGFSLVTADGRSSLGSTFLPFEPDPRDYERRLRQGGARYLPAIADAPNPGLRACARPLALDGRPLVGPVPGRTATGCSWPPATVRGGSRPARPRRHTSRRSCWASRTRASRASGPRRTPPASARRRSETGGDQRQLFGSNR